MAAGPGRVDVGVAAGADVGVAAGFVVGVGSWPGPQARRKARIGTRKAAIRDGQGRCWLNLFIGATPFLDGSLYNYKRHLTLLFKPNITGVNLG